MENPIVAKMQARIGKKIESSSSPLANWLQGTLQEVREGALTVDFTVREEMTNPMGILHGGMMAAIMDDIIGATVFTLGKEHFFTTVNLSIDYLASAQKGKTVRAQTKIVRAGNTIVNAECYVTDLEGKLLAKGTSNLLRTHIKVNS